VRAVLVAASLGRPVGQVGPSCEKRLRKGAAESMRVGTVGQPRRKGPWKARSDPRRVLRIGAAFPLRGDGAGNLEAARRHRSWRADLRERVFVQEDFYKSPWKSY
jgi:hypothetical protein